MKSLAGPNALDKMPKSVSQLKALKELRELNRMDEMLNRALNKGSAAFNQMEKWRKTSADGEQGKNNHRKPKEAWARAARG